MPLGSTPRLVTGRASARRSGQEVPVKEAGAFVGHERECQLPDAIVSALWGGIYKVCMLKEKLMLIDGQATASNASKVEANVKKSTHFSWRS